VDANPEKIFNVIVKFAEKLGVVDTVEPDRLLLLRPKFKTPGAGWLEWRISQAADSTYLTQTVFFAPHGTAGFLYWGFLYPFRAIGFHWLIKNIVRRSITE
jgi:hypothetical protein